MMIAEIGIKESYVAEPTAISLPSEKNSGYKEGAVAERSFASFDSRTETVPAGRFNEFDIASRFWSSWLGRHHFYGAHDIDTAEKREPHLLALRGE